MAVIPRNFQLTRDQVSVWLKEYDGKLQPSLKLRVYLEEKVEELALGDATVITSAHDDLGDSTHIVDMLLMDLASYGH